MKDRSVTPPRCDVLLSAMPTPPPILWRWRWAIAVLVMATAGGCSHLPRRGPAGQDVIIARQLSQQGMDALHKGSISQAEERFSKAIEHCPENTTARYQLANCLWKRGARREAIEQLAKAIDMASDEDVEMTVELGYMWANVGQLDQALELAEQSIRIMPEYPLAWQLRGDILRRKGEWSEALGNYHRCLTYDPHNTDVQLSVAEVYYELDRPARVLATLHHLEDELPLEHQPERMLVLKSLACLQLERNEEAVIALTRAVPQRRLSHGAQVQLARAQLCAGKFGEAEETIRRVLPEASATDLAMLRQLQANMTQQRARAAGTSLR